ncbi:bifunctional Post-transcriptional regulator MKT1 [Babesia duncani]|uniref:Bifunctional Post-transcriptional regulator MKT1 n=1 Tax=Babesia duncani TaxID=323732 RepID=A0AAD9PNX0_9APIC|nr:bifunctional Post-transcriptional regulator MKT1 [Babesia duncani]
MRVRQLQTFLREQKIARTSDLALCRGMRIGIDAIYFFRSLKGVTDPLSDASNSLSPGFFASVDEQLQAMDRLQIQPLFVFQGMQPRSHLLLSVQMMGFAMHEAWALYNRGDRQAAITKFGQGPYKEFSESSIQLLINYLKSNGREVVRAPYFATSQLSYFVQESLVDAIVGPPSVLLFNVPRTIIALDFVRNTFEWLELDEILSRFEMDKEQLVDACLLAGTEHCVTYPLLPQAFNFSNVIDCIKQAPVIKYLSQLPTRDGLAEYVDGYCVAKSLVMYPLVMTINGDVAPLFRRLALPNDYYKIVGGRLPRNLYYLMCEGLVSVQIPFALALNEWMDEPNPHADSLEYRDLLQDVREYQCRAIGLVVLKLDKTYHNRHIRFPGQVTLKGPTPHLKNGVVMIPNTCPARIWTFTSDELNAELNRQKCNNVDVSMLLRWHFTEKMPKPLVPTHQLMAQQELDPKTLGAKVYMMLLDNMGYFTRELGPTAFGKVLANTQMSNVGLVVLELLKFGLFTGDPLEPPLDVSHASELYQTTPQDPQEALDFKAINLVARLSSLCPMEHLDTMTWRGMVDFDIACFNAIVRCLSRSINYLAEGCLAYLVLGYITRMELIPTPVMPLYSETDAFMGVVVKALLNESAPTQRQLLDSLAVKFPNCLHLQKDLNNLANFWQQLSSLVGALHDLVGLGETMEKFRRGTKILKTALEKAGVKADAL